MEDEKFLTCQRKKKRVIIVTGTRTGNTAKPASCEDTVSNFAFLKDRFPELAMRGFRAERNLYSDPQTSLSEIRKIGTHIANYVLFDKGIACSVINQVDRIEILRENNDLPRRQCNQLLKIEQSHNKSKQELLEDSSLVMLRLNTCYRLCEWFMQTYGDPSYIHQPFIIPEK